MDIKAMLFVLEIVFIIASAFVEDFISRAGISAIMLGILCALYKFLF